MPALGQGDGIAALAERLKAAPWAKSVEVAAGVVRVDVTDADAASREILPLVVAAGVALTSFEQAQPTLEDVFLELVGPASPDELDGRGHPPAARGRPVVTGFSVLLRKELLEQWRTLRLPVIAAVFVVIGLGSPLLARFTPELLEALGGAQFQIVLPPPTTADAVDQLIKNVSQFGILVAVLLAMGSVATEKERGTAGLILTKPASRGAFLFAKLVAIGGTLGGRDVPRGGRGVVLHADPVRGTPRRRVRGLGAAAVARADGLRGDHVPRQHADPLGAGRGRASASRRSS